MRLPLAACLVLACCASSVRADEPPKPADDYIELSKIGLPVVWRGRLVNYVFVSVRLKLGRGRDAKVLRVEEPYFRDALVRAGHRKPFADPSGDLSRLDEQALDATLLPEVQRIAGPGWVTRVDVASQEPRRRLPRPLAAPSAGRPIIP